MYQLLFSLHCEITNLSRQDDKNDEYAYRNPIDVKIISVEHWNHIRFVINYLQEVLIL